MRVDPVLRNWHQVKMNFQAINRAPVPPDVWERIKEIVAQRDPRTGEMLDRYEVGADVPLADGASEQAFEDNVVLPILERLGWCEGSTLKRQHGLWVKIGSGRARRVVADFVGFRGALSAEVLLVVETKRRIRSDAELKSAREQAESYAGKLRCSRFAVAAPEGVWVYELRFPMQSKLLAEVRMPAPATPEIETKLQVLSFEQLSSSADRRAGWSALPGNARCTRR